MSRSGYSDDFGDDDPLALGRYRAQVNSAIRGKRGQALLRELLAALDAMPEKRLVAGELEADGQFCALGVVGQARGLNLSTIDTYDVESLGPKFNIAEQLAREIMWVNDEAVSETRWVEVENSPMLTVRGLGIILGDLAELGFDAEWGVLSAADTGAPHLRERIWVLGTNVADPVRERQQGFISRFAHSQDRQEPHERPHRPRGNGLRPWPTESGMGRTSDGPAYRVDRIKALGNGQVPRVVAAAWEILA